MRNGDSRKKANEFDEEEWQPTDLMIRSEGVCLGFIQGRREFQSGRSLSSAVGLNPFVGLSFEHVVGRVATSCWSIQIDRANLSLHIPFTLHILNFPTNIAPRASILWYPTVRAVHFYLRRLGYICHVLIIVAQWPVPK